MRPTRWLTLAAALFLALPLFGGRAFAEPHGGPGGPGGHGGRLEAQLQKLGLSESQKTKVEAILSAAKPQREEIRERMRKEFDSMRTLLDQDSPKQSDVLAQADRIGAISTEMHKARLTTLLAVRAELTPEQRAKLKEAMQKHGHGRWHHGQRGDSGGGEPKGPPAPESEQ